MTECSTSRCGDDAYPAFLHALQEHFLHTVQGAPALFTTDVSEDLFSVFLDALPSEEVQSHRCHACRRFVQQYGHIVTVSDSGTTTPVLWGSAPGIYQAPVEKLRELVSRAKVNGVFITPRAAWGTASTASVKSPAGAFQHMAVTLPPEKVWTKRTQTAGQRMAELQEDYTLLTSGLAEFGLPTLQAALRVLRAEALYRSERVLGVAEWLVGVHQLWHGGKMERGCRRSLLWRAVATAPAGFCHVRSTMIGTLLADLEEGLPFEEVQRRFAAKMNPLQYQRPQAAPSEGQIAEAERVVATLKSAGALERRFARLEDVQVRLWEPRPLPADSGSPGGVFGHLKPVKSGPQITLPERRMTWRKFEAEVLPTALKLEYHVRSGQLPLIGLVTAVHADAPPILQWDSPEQRNPVSWFVFHNGSVAEAWNLTRGAWVSVTAVTPLPMLWHRPEAFRHQGEGVVFLLDGCRCLVNRSLVLFPEHLRSEYHAIRRTIEAYSDRGRLAGSDEATACGIDFRKNREGMRQLPLRVTTQEGQALYLLDRWD